MRDNEGHPTVEDIHRGVQEVMPDMSLATIYHTLNDLLEMGEVVQLNLGEGKSQYHPTTEHHHHVVCLACRRVLDTRRAFNGLKLLPEEAPGYQIVRRELVFYGFCPDCRE
jgi:Fe2+ or Zn2+ uptake regulation protein